MIASALVLHVIDYVMQNRAKEPKAGDGLVCDFTKQAAQDCFSFEVVRGFALASKHCNLSSRPGFNSGEHMIATPAFAGVMGAGDTFVDDTVGGITVQWTDRGYVNLTTALQKTLEFYETEFPELLS
jgi:hypothetical protein